MKQIDKKNWIWMPHAGHFIGANYCNFRLNTYVGKYIVSSVGEYLPYRGNLTKNNDIAFIEIGANRKYETMVFKAKKSKHRCCEYEVADYSEIDLLGYNDAESAYAGHLLMCQKWSEL